MEAHFGDSKGKTIARVGPGLQAARPTTCAKRRPSRSSRRCSSKGAKVQAYDPEAMTIGQGASSATAITYREKSYDALKGADALAIVTEWNEFREPDFAAHASSC